MEESSSSPQLPEAEESSTDGTGLEFDEPDFGAITDFVDGNGEDEPLPVAAEAEDEPEIPAEEPEVEAAATDESESVEAPKEVEEPPAPVEPEVQAEPEAPAPEPVKLPTKEELQGLYEEHRAKTLPELEKIFTLSDEEAAALDEQPSKVLPKLAAQLQYDAMLSTYNAVLAALPGVLGTYMTASNLAQQAEGKFMEAWPDLKSDKAKPVAMAAVQAYRAANPRASLEETIKSAGVMAMIQLGLDPMKPQVSPEKKAAPAKRKAPPRPVSPTGQSPVPPAKNDPEENEFSKLAEAFRQEFN